MRKGGSTALHLRDENDREALERVTKLVRAFGGSAPLVLNARQSFYFGNDASGDWSRPSTMRGTHGYAPKRPEMYASLILAGPFERRGSLGVVRMTQIAPAIAEFLGIRLAPEAAEGIALR